MAEETATQETVTEESNTTTEVKPTEDGLGDAGKKALDAERRNARQAAKERDALAARLQEFEDRDKTEAQKLADRADAAEKRAAELETRALRLEVASEKGLTTAQAKRLVGSTREELEADADELLETFKPAEAPKPAVDLDLGTRSTATSTGDQSPRGLITAGLEASTKKKP